MTTKTVTMPYESPIGRLVLECDGDVLIGIWLPNERRHARNDVDDVPPVLKETASQLDEYFAGERTDFDVQISYGEVARRVGRPSAPRAVGQANGRNPIPVIVPCHRVVASDGIGGYGGGLNVKRKLLAVEGVTA